MREYQAQRENRGDWAANGIQERAQRCGSSLRMKWYGKDTSELHKKPNNAERSTHNGVTAGAVTVVIR